MKGTATEILEELQKQYTDCKFTLKIELGKYYIYAEKNGLSNSIGMYKDNCKVYIKSFLSAVESYEQKDNEYYEIYKKIDNCDAYYYEPYSKKDFLSSFILDDFIEKNANEIEKRMMK